MRRLLTAVIFFLVTTIVGQAAYGQSFTWSPPVDLSNAGSSVDGPSIAVSKDGSTATAVWQGATSIQTSTATIAGGVPSWGPVIVLASGGTYSAPVIRISRDGSKATAFWERQKSSAVIVMQAASATISANVATWGTPSEFSIREVDNTLAPSFVLSDDGTLGVLAWSELYTDSRAAKPRDYATVQVASATISGTSITWGRSTRLSALGQVARNPSIAISDAGTAATIVWCRSDGKTDIVQARSGTINGTTSSWGRVTDLSAIGFNSREAKVAVSADGTRATVVWSRFGANQSRVIRTRSATISGSVAQWGGTTALTPINKVARLPQMALSADGSRASAAWIVDGVVQSAAAIVDGDTATWGSAADVSSRGGGPLLGSLAMSTDGSKAFLAWQRKSNVTYVVQTSAAVVNGTTQQWGPVADVSDPSSTVAAVRGQLSGDGLIAATIWRQALNASSENIRSSIGSILHPTPTPTPVIPDTPTPTPTPAATATPVGSQRGEAPAPNHSSNDGRVVLRMRDTSASFRRDYYGYLVGASDQKRIAYGKFKVSRNRGTLVLNNIPSGEYLTFTVVFRSITPKVISSKYRRIYVK